MKWLAVILTAFLFFGCADEFKGDAGEDGTTTVIYRDATEDTDGVDEGSSGTVSNLTGKAEAGMCYLLSDVSGADVNLLWELSNFIPGEMTQNDGTFNIPGAFSGPYIFKKFDGSCYSEGDNLDVDNVKMRSVCPLAADPCNINHATTWNVSLANRYFNDSSHTEYQDLAGSYIQARTDIYTYLGFSSASANFYGLSIIGDTTADAYLLAFETAVSKGRTGPEQGDYIGQAVNAVIDNDLTFRAALRDTIAGLSVKSVVDNLNAKLTSLGFSETAAPIWNLPMIPSYYADLLTRTPTEVESANTGVSTTCAFDDPTTYNWFFYPVRFDSIESANYAALKYMDGDISLYSVKTCNQGSGDFPCPDAELITLDELNEILLPLSNANYNGSLVGHSLSNSVNLFWAQKKASNFGPTFACGSGDLNDFGSALASNDNGASFLILTGTAYQRKQPFALYD